MAAMNQSWVEHKAAIADYKRKEYTENTDARERQKARVRARYHRLKENPTPEFERWREASRARAKANYNYIKKKDRVNNIVGGEESSERSPRPEPPSSTTPEIPRARPKKAEKLTTRRIVPANPE